MQETIDELHLGGAIRFRGDCGCLREEIRENFGGDP